MRVILVKINELWEYIKSLVNTRAPQPPAIPAVIAAQKWVILSGLSAEEAKIYSDPMDGFDNILLDGEGFNTRTI